MASKEFLAAFAAAAFAACLATLGSMLSTSSFLAASLRSRASFRLMAGYGLDDQQLLLAHEPICHAPGLLSLWSDVQKQAAAVRVLLHFSVALPTFYKGVSQFHGLAPAVRISCLAVNIPTKFIYN